MRARAVVVLLAVALLVAPAVADARPRSLASPLKALLSSPRVSAAETGDGTALVTITGGRRPYTLKSATGAYIETVDTRAKTMTEVPLDAGITTFQVTDAVGQQAESAPLTYGLYFWVSDNATNRVFKYDADTATKTVEITSETWSGIRNLETRATDDHLFVVDQYLNKVVEFDPAGAFVRRFTVPGAYRLQDVTFDAAGRIYTLDRSIPPVISRYSATGSFEASAQVPPSAEVGFPPYLTLTSMSYYGPSDWVLVRYSTGAIACVSARKLEVQTYRYSADSLMVPLWDIDPVTDSLYSGTHPGTWGRQPDFIGGVGYLVPGGGTYQWSIASVKANFTDMGVDANGDVYTLQFDSGGTMGRPATGVSVYAFSPLGVQLGEWVLPAGTRLSLVR